MIWHFEIFYSRTIYLSSWYFGQCAIFPLDTDINVASEHGLTAQADIFHLGCLIYSIVTWKKYMYDLFMHDWTQPPLGELPDVDELFCGNIIRKCWTAEYTSMEQMHYETRDNLMRTCKATRNGDLDKILSQRWITDFGPLPIRHK